MPMAMFVFPFAVVAMLPTKVFPIVAGRLRGPAACNPKRTQLHSSPTTLESKRHRRTVSAGALLRSLQAEAYRRSPLVPAVEAADRRGLDRARRAMAGC